MVHLWQYSGNAGMVTCNKAKHTCRSPFDASCMSKAVTYMQWHKHTIIRTCILKVLQKTTSFYSVLWYNQQAHKQVSSKNVEACRDGCAKTTHTRYTRHRGNTQVTPSLHLFFWMEHALLWEYWKQLCAGNENKKGCRDGVTCVFPYALCCPVYIVCVVFGTTIPTSLYIFTSQKLMNLHILQCA